MQKKIIDVLKYLFFLSIGILLIWWQFGKMTDVQKIQFRESLLHANYKVLIPVVIMSLLSHVSRAYRWKLLLEPMGYRPKTSNAFYTVMCGYFANTFLPRAGEILRCTLLSRYEKIPVSRLIGTILLERIFDLFCYFLLIVITILIQIGVVRDFLERVFLNSGNHAIAGTLIKLLAVVICLTGVVLFTRRLLKKYADHRHVQRFRHIQAGLKEGFLTIIHLKRRGAFIGHTIFIWAMYVLQIYVGFQALTETSGLGMNVAFSILSLATLAMIVSPGGIGAFPVAVQQVLLIYSIENISFGWLMWGTTTGIMIVAGIISFILLIVTNKQKNEGDPGNKLKNITD